jgi:tRNA modification GTPase
VAFGSEKLDQTFVAVLTPAGRGAVATVAVRGPQAIALVSRCFAPAAGRPLAALAPGEVAFGKLAVIGGATEEAVVGIVSPKEVEVHCHGGLAVTEAAVAALTAAGATRIDWRQWATITEHDEIKAEAIIALAEARTERTAAILLDQYRGALASAIARGDDPASLLQWADLGLHLTQPWQVVLCGRPNVGKSSLINALVGYTRAIVHDQPGTTRDVLSAAAAFDGWPVVLSDTAGLREGESPIEAEGVARAKTQIAAADLLLLVTDAPRPWTSADEVQWHEIQSLPPGRCRQLVIHNKCDAAPVPSDSRPQGLAVSALTKAGLAELEQAISAALVPIPPPPGTAVPFTERQIQLLQSPAR